MEYINKNLLDKLDNNNIFFVKIPANTTSFLQPQDISPKLKLLKKGIKIFFIKFKDFYKMDSNDIKFFNKFAPIIYTYLNPITSISKFNEENKKYLISITAVLFSIQYNFNRDNAFNILLNNPQNDPLKYIKDLYEKVNKHITNDFDVEKLFNSIIIFNNKGYLQNDIREKSYKCFLSSNTYIVFNHQEFKNNVKKKVKLIEI